MMSGPPVTLGCAVMVSPGSAGPPDRGFIVQIPQTSLAIGGMPLAVSGSMCQMVNSVSGAPYPLVIGPLASTGIRVNGMALVRVGDSIPSPPGILTVLGPPAAPFFVDTRRHDGSAPWRLTSLAATLRALYRVTDGRHEDVDVGTRGREVRGEHMEDAASSPASTTPCRP